MDLILEMLAKELERKPEHVENVVRLLDEGATIPFIARYRKELHGSMDDQLLRTLAERLQYLRGLAQRREAVKASTAAGHSHTAARADTVEMNPSIMAGTRWRAQPK